MRDIAKKSLKSALDRVGISIRRRNCQTDPDLQLATVVKHLEVDLVLDVGANTGQFALSLRSHGYKGRITSFEPQRAAHDELIKLSQGDRDWTIFPRVAIGDCVGEAQLNISRNSVSSSLLPMEDRHSAAASESVYVNTELVPVSPLDLIALHDVKAASSPYLKVDTQGFEKKVLAGSQLILKEVVAVQLELSLLELYTGQPLLEEMIACMKASGFHLFAILPGFTDLKTGRSLQLDGVFVATDAH